MAGNPTPVNNLDLTKPGPGRPKGSQAKVTIMIKEMIEGALQDVGGRKYLAYQALENPGPFMTLVGKILPKDITVTGDLVIEQITRTIIDDK
jgi:hypothetical protein